MAKRFLYKELADKIESQIKARVFAPGAKIPGTRALAKRYKVSVNTVLQAQKVLEHRGLVEALPRSGFFVKHTPPLGHPRPLPSRNSVAMASAPKLVSDQRLVMDLVAAAHSSKQLSLGAALPHESFFPSEVLRGYLTRHLRRDAAALCRYSFPPGDGELRATLAKKMLTDGISCEADDIVITAGCHDALLLALKATTKAGDVVALESPTYYGILQALESMQLKAIEIPSIGDGMDVSALKTACDKWNIAACVLVSSFSNPLGGLMSVDHKQALLDTLNHHNIPLIEDDIYGDLAFSGERPAPFASLCDVENVIYCNSFSKTLAPGLRIGWVSSARYAATLSHLKFSQSLGVATVEQKALNSYLNHGHYTRHIRRLQRRLSVQVQSVSQYIETYFPKPITISKAKGGFVLWLSLPEGFDTYTLYKAAALQGVSIAPGRVFSVNMQFDHCFRINCAQPWDVLEPALDILAELLNNGFES